MIPFIYDTGKIIVSTPNSKQSVEVPTGTVIREIYLRLTGAITATAANNTVANTQIGDEWGQVLDISVRMDGRDYIKQIDGPALRWLNFYLYGQFPYKTKNQIGDGITANPSFDSTLILPFWMPKSVRPMDFALDTRMLDRLDIDIQWGTFTNVNSAATAFTTTPQINIYFSDVTNVQGQFARWNVFHQAFSFTGAQTKAQMKLPVGYMYRSILLQDVSAVLTTIRFKAGRFEWITLPVQILQSAQINRHGDNIVQLFQNNTNWRAGSAGDDNLHWMYLDFVGDGFNAEAINSAGLSEIYLEIDTSATGNFVLYPQQLVVPQG